MVEGEKETRPRIGISWDTRLTISHPSPIELVNNSVTSTFNTLGAVASPKSDVKLQHLSGPFGIVRIYYLFLVSEHGWQLALWLSVVLNVNLAILNMLPIPVLDGAPVCFGLIESIRRRPLSIRVLEAVQGVCTLLIIGLIAYISIFDVQDWPLVKRLVDKISPSQSQKAKDQDVPWLALAPVSPSHMRCRSVAPAVKLAHFFCGFLRIGLQFFRNTKEAWQRLIECVDWALLLLFFLLIRP